MKTDLIGVWSADALFAPGSQEDEIIVFRSNGTGWIELMFGAHEVEFFEWTPTSPGWVDFVSQGKFERDTHNRARYIEVEKTFEVEHLPFLIKEVETPLHSSIAQLELQLPGCHAGLYGLVQEDADARPKPG